jgi:hypothetical protein
MNVIVEHDLIPGEWTPVGPPVADDGDDALRSGSLSSTDEEGTRTLYLFGWYEGDGPKLWRSRSGADLELTDERGWPRRVVLSDALDVVAELTEEPTTLRLRQHGHWLTVRLRCVP